MPAQEDCCCAPVDRHGTVATACGDCDPGCFRATVVILASLGIVFILFGLVAIYHFVGVIMLLIGISLAGGSMSLCCFVQTSPRPPPPVARAEDPPMATVVVETDVEMAADGPKLPEAAPAPAEHCT